jgi:glyoxylase-like metal-dependent hydrolase (beta-lactamase superfamily II)
MQQIMGYRVEELQKGLWAIDDEKDDSMYLVEGTQKSLLIDTCMVDGPLTLLLRQLTSKPVELALTHAHIDHMYHAPEFETVYLHQADIDDWHAPWGRFSVWADAPVLHVKRKHYDVKHYRPLKDGDLLDLGGVQLRVLPAPGHTPGSIILIDDVHRVLFLGDAVGSGAGALMALPECLTISRYRDELDNLLPRLLPYKDYTFLGGHRRQATPTPQFPDAGPLTFEVVEDMKTLCEKMLSGTVAPQPAGRLGITRLYQYKTGRAAMVEKKSKIK